MKNNRLKFRLNSNRPSNAIICVFFISLFFVAIGFAYIRSSLAINGSTEIVKGAWNIHFDNIRNVTSSGSTLEVKNAPKLNDSKKIIDFSLKFNNDFEYYQFIVDIVNEGEIGAIVEDIRFNLGSLTDFFNYSITYEDGRAFNIGDAIAAQTTKTIKVYLGINSRANLTLLPEDINYQISLEIPFVQEGYKPQNYYVDILGAKQIAYIDNKESKYVTSNTGIDFSDNSSDTNGKGLYLRAGTENDEYPIYYYRGEVDNNNVLFGGFCWQIIRTTDTGGTKMIYNGIPDANGKCVRDASKKGKDRQLDSKIAFNSKYTSPADIGYMVGTRYEYTFIEHITTENSTSATTYFNPLYRLAMDSDSNYYYSKSYTVSDNQYTLDNPTELGSWSTAYKTLPGEGYYTCASTSTGSCSTLYYVVGTSSYYAYTVPLTNGNTLDQENFDMKVAQNINKNEDGTYSLVNPITLKRSTWYTNYSKFRGYYICSDNRSGKCSEMLYIAYTSPDDYEYIDVKNIKYGNSVEWDGTNYTLKDTIEFYNWAKAINQLNNNHYTCLNENEKCTKVYYIYNEYTTGNDFYYIELENGKKIEEALKEMTTESANTTNSTIKEYIENTWYKNNMTLYSDYLEDTPYCNNRAISDYAGWNPNGGTISNELQYDPNSRTFNTYKLSLECQNKNDRFTVSGEIGNGKNKYKVGLITSDEAMLGGAKGSSNHTSYLYTGQAYWTLSPSRFSRSVASGIDVTSSGILSDFTIWSARGVRPVVSLNATVKAVSGDGSSTNPYVIG